MVNYIFTNMKIRNKEVMMHSLKKKSHVPDGIRSRIAGVEI